MSDAFSKEVIKNATKDILLLSALEKTYSGFYAFTANRLFEGNVPYDFANKDVIPYIENPTFLSLNNKKDFLNCSSVYNLYTDNKFKHVREKTLSFLNSQKLSEEEISFHLANTFSLATGNSILTKNQNFNNVLNAYMDEVIALGDTIKESGLIALNNDVIGIKYRWIQDLLERDDIAWDIFEKDPSPKFCKFVASVVLCGKFSDKFRSKCVNWNYEARKEVFNHLPKEYHSSYSSGYYCYSTDLFSLVKTGLDKGYQVFDTSLGNSALHAIKDGLEKRKAIIKYLSLSDNIMSDFKKIGEFFDNYSLSKNNQIDLFDDVLEQFESSKSYAEKIVNLRLMLVIMNTRKDVDVNSDISSFSEPLRGCIKSLGNDLIESEENTLLFFETLAQGCSIVGTTSVFMDILDESVEVIFSDKENQKFLKDLLGCSHVTNKEFYKEGLKSLQNDSLGEKLLPFLNKKLTIKDVKKYPALSKYMLTAKKSEYYEVLFDGTVNDSNFETLLFVNSKVSNEGFSKKITGYLATTFSKTGNEEFKEKILFSLLKYSKKNKELFNSSIYPMLKETIDSYVKKRLPDSFKFSKTGTFFLKKNTATLGDEKMFLDSLSRLLEDSKTKNDNLESFENVLLKVAFERKTNSIDGCVRLKLNTAEEFKIHAKSLQYFSGFNACTITALPALSINEFEKLNVASLYNDKGQFTNISAYNLAPCANSDIKTSIETLRLNGNVFVGSLFYNRLRDLDIVETYNLGSYLSSLKKDNKELYLSCVGAISEEVKSDRLNGSVSSMLSREITTSDVLPILSVVSEKEITWSNFKSSDFLLGNFAFEMGHAFNSPVAFNAVVHIRSNASSFFSFEDRKNLESNKDLIKGKLKKDIDLTDLEPFLKSLNHSYEDEDAKAMGVISRATVQVFKDSLEHDADSFEVKKAKLFKDLLTMKLAQLKMVFVSEMDNFEKLLVATETEHKINKVFNDGSLESSANSPVERFKL